MHNEEGEENYYQCLYCGATFDTEEERDVHTFEKHMDAVEEKLSEIRNIAEEHSETISEWKTAKKKELLLKIATENPRLLHELQGTHSEEILEKMIQEDLFKRALKTNTLSSFDAMWLRHPQFEKIYRASREKPEHQPRTGDSTGQTEEFFESPDAMISTTQKTNIKENLSEEESGHRKQMILVLQALLRKRGSN